MKSRPLTAEERAWWEKSADGQGGRAKDAALTVISVSLEEEPASQVRRPGEEARLSRSPC
jgi:hypothetical protein